MDTLRSSGRYRGFINDRDLALERIHQHAQVDLSRLLYSALESVSGFASHLAGKASKPGAWHVVQHHFERGTGEIFGDCFKNLIMRIKSLRRATFVLTYASEREAIGRATKFRRPVTPAEYRLRREEALNAPTLEGPLDMRMWHCCLLLRGRIVQAFNLAVIQGLKPEEIMAKVRAAYPKPVVYARPPKALTKLKEAAGRAIGDTEALTTDFIDDADWDMMVDAYKGTELPPNRFDDNQPSASPTDRMVRYEWEGEQEATEDFVKQVRDGQVSAAKDLGIQEFVWVAVLDDKTCDDCCAPRAGLTTTEIEALGDACDATVPPAHFNCRCQVAPVASTDEVAGPDWQGFNDWLET